MAEKLDKEHNLESEKEVNKDMEIDLLEIFRRIIAIRKTLYKAAGFGLIVGLIVAISIPKQYTVNVTLSPEMGNSNGNNGIAGIAASFLGSGVTMGENADALNASLSADIVSSTPFLLELFNMEVSISNQSDKITFESYLDECHSPWWNYVIGFPGIVANGVKMLFEDRVTTINKLGQGTIELTKEENKKIIYLKKNIKASIDKKTAITHISVTLQNPRVAADIADSVIHKLQKCIIDYRTFKAKEDCIYLERLFKERQEEYYTTQRKYAEYVDMNDNLILQSVRAEQERLQNDMNLAYQIYSQVANQLQVARAKVQEVKPIFAIVEPAVVPLKPSSMSGKFYVLLFMFCSVFCVTIWMLFGKDILDSLKREIKK